MIKNTDCATFLVEKARNEVADDDADFTLSARDDPVSAIFNILSSNLLHFE